MSRFTVRKVLNRVSFRFSYQVWDNRHSEPVGNLYRKVAKANRLCDRCNYLSELEAHKYREAKDNG